MIFEILHSVLSESLHCFRQTVVSRVDISACHFNIELKWRFYMRFPNAYEGISRIRKAELLNLLTVVIAVLAGLITAVIAVSSMDDESAEALTLIPLFLLAVSLIIPVISVILTILGLIKALKDEKGFRTALYSACASFAMSILSALLSAGKNSSSILRNTVDVGSSITKILTVIFVCFAISSLAVQCSRNDIKEKSVSVMTFVGGSYLLSSLIRVAPNFLHHNVTNDFVTSVASLISVFISAAGYFMYLRFLKNAKKMLADAK